MRYLVGKIRKYKQIMWQTIKNLAFILSSAGVAPIASR
jgi:hypothetical protein